MINRSLFYRWGITKKNNNKKSFILNFGPQHPAAHGVLRLILQLNCEIIQKCDIHIGLLHRSTERLITKKHYLKSLPYFDRLDYVSMMTQEHSYCIAIEKLTNIYNKNYKINYIRIIFDELTRIMNHLLAIACHALDIGSMSSLFWAFEEREKLMEFYERVSGARMHAAYHKPYNYFDNNIDYKLIEDILLFNKECFKTLNEIHSILTLNKIWKNRLINIGAISYEDCQNWGLTGVMSRSAGIKRDLRLDFNNVYSSYKNISFKSFVGINGDTYDRFLIRMLEMGESINIVNKVINLLFKSSFFNKDINIVYKNLFIKNKQKNYSSMEDLINHFILWHSGFLVKKNTSLSYIESPKGEFGIILTADNTMNPYNCKIKSPSFSNLQFLPKLIKGHYLSDLSSLIGTIDIVFGEIDR